MRICRCGRNVEPCYENDGDCENCFADRWAKMGGHGGIVRLQDRGNAYDRLRTERKRRNKYG